MGLWSVLYCTMVDLEPNTSRTYMGLCTVHVTPYPHSHNHCPNCETSKPNVLKGNYLLRKDSSHCIPAGSFMVLQWSSSSMFCAVLNTAFRCLVVQHIQRVDKLCIKQRATSACPLQHATNKGIRPAIFLGGR